MVSKVKWVLKVQLVLQVTRVQAEFLVMQVHKVPWVRQAHVDQEEVLVKRERQETKVSLVPQVVTVFQVLVVYQVPPGRLVCQERMEIREKKDHQEKRASREVKVMLDHQAHLDRKVCVAPLVQQEPQENVAHQV